MGKVISSFLLLFSIALIPEALSWAQESKSWNSKTEKFQFREKISQFGITWTFDGKVPVGKFVNGDYYVVGDVTVVSITPKPENGRNGSVLGGDGGRS